MSNIAIKFENISKQYRLGVVGTGTISHDLNRWWHLVRGKEDPYLKVGEVLLLYPNALFQIPFIMLLFVSYCPACKDSYFYSIIYYNSSL